MIGDRLKQIRKEKSLSQKALADLLATSSGYISEIEQNKTIPGGKFLTSLNRALIVSVDWLLTGEGEPYLPATAIEDVNRKGAHSSLECSPQDIEISDAELIQQFRDKSYSKDLILCLAELEQVNTEAFKKVGPYINGLLDGLRMRSSESKRYTGPERREFQRRVKDDPKGFKGAKDRRSGKDRRAAARR